MYTSIKVSKESDGGMEVFVAIEEVGWVEFGVKFAFVKLGSRVEDKVVVGSGVVVVVDLEAELSSVDIWKAKFSKSSPFISNTKESRLK